MQGKLLDSVQKQKFLAKLRAQAGNVSKAAKAAGISRNVAYEHKKTDADFSSAWDSIIDDVVDSMEQELHRRSTKGVIEPVFYKGEQIATVRKFSDRLLEFALKAKRPDVYRERFDVNQNVTGTLDLNIQATINQIYADGSELEPEAVDTKSAGVDTGTDQDG